MRREKIAKREALLYWGKKGWCWRELIGVGGWGVEWWVRVCEIGKDAICGYFTVCDMRVGDIGDIGMGGGYGIAGGGGE